MAPDPEDGDFDEQDQSETFDEDNTNLDEERVLGEDAETLEELPDVFDVTTALGDEDDDEALIGEDLDDEDIVELERDLDDEEDDEDYQTLDLEDDGDVEEPDEVGLEYVGDLTDRAHARSAAQPFESRRLSDEDLRELRYRDEKEDDMDGLPRTPRENDVEGLHDRRRDDRGEGTETPPEALPENHPKRHQEELLDEGVEETFPASDPVSVKRIT